MTDPTNRKLRGVLFDFDGTIAETERHGHRVAYNRAFAARGLDWRWDEKLYGELLAVAGGKERLHHYLRQYHPDLADRPGTPALVEELHRAKAQYFGEVAASIPLRPGVRRLIHEAHSAGLRVAIATTAAPGGVEALFSQDAGLFAAIDLIAAGDVVERKKPAPDIFLWALDRLDLRSEACVAIEDSHIGLRAALAAHLTTIVTPSDYSKDEDFNGAASVLSDLGEKQRPARCIAGACPPAGIVDVAFLAEICD